MNDESGGRKKGFVSELWKEDKVIYKQERLTKLELSGPSESEEEILSLKNTHKTYKLNTNESHDGLFNIVNQFYSKMFVLSNFIYNKTAIDSTDNTRKE